MNFRNNKSANKTGLLTIEGSSYVLARSQFFYFLEVINYEKELYKTDTTLTSTPSVIFYTENGTNKVVLDYNSSNTSDKLYLKSFFAGLPVNSGFSLINGDYLQEAKSIDADVTCNLTFKQFKDNYVFAELNTVQNKHNKADIYYKNYFLNVPQLQSGLSLGSTPLTRSIALVNHKINNNYLSSLGFTKNDYIEIINNNSENTNKKFKIKDYQSLSDKELLFIDSDNMSPESLLGMPVLVNLYCKSKSKITESFNPADNTGLGCCITAVDEPIVSVIRKSLYSSAIPGTSTINSGNLNVQLTDNANLIRSTTKTQCEILTGNSTSFVPGCVVNNSNVGTLPVVDDYLYYATPAYAFDVSFKDNAFVFTSASNNPQNGLTYYKYENGILYLNEYLTYRLNQNDTSNNNKIIRFSVDENGTQLYQRNVWGKQTGIGLNSVLYLRTDPMIPTLYMFIENNSDIKPVPVMLIPGLSSTS